MKRSVKILTLLFCAAVCATGTILSQKESAKEESSQIVPVKNNQVHRDNWLRV
jgi:hypothetical protein